MKNGKLYMNTLSWSEHEQFPAISTISDDTFFDMLSASECLRFIM